MAVVQHATKMANLREMDASRRVGAEIPNKIYMTLAVGRIYTQWERRDIYACVCA